MKVKLAHHFFPDDKDWQVVNETVPLGTEYEVLGFQSKCSIGDLITGRIREVDLYLLRGHGDIGWVPAVCFETVES